MTTHVVMYSGGITSWAVARRLVDSGITPILLFADVLAEDEDLYRFNRDVERNLGIAITTVSDGRTPQEVGRDRKHIGNTRVANCSHLLKQKPCRDWLAANTDPADTTVYVGIDWTEVHRMPGITRNWAPWEVAAPLADPPYTSKAQHLEAARAQGLEPPRLYAMGFAHNNCGGACVKAGQAQWAHLLKVFPARFASWEAHEEAMRAVYGDVAILRDRRGGVTKPLPLAAAANEIRRYEAGYQTLAAEKATMRHGYEINQVGLLAKLAEVRTGKSRVGDGVDRRGWTDEQWLEEARSIFYDAFGGAGDLLNGHVSAMWKQLTAAKKEQEQLAAIVAATLRQLGTVLGVNISEEITKARPKQQTPPTGCYHCGSVARREANCPVCRPPSETELKASQ